MREIEFYGGAFDGHRHCLEGDRPAERLAWLVCDDVFRILGGKRQQDLGAVTSVAIYELNAVDGGLRYDHISSISFEALMTSLETRGIQIRKGPIHGKR